MRGRIRVVASTVLLGVGVTIVPASAQVTTATVAGSVRDPQGAAVPGASVTLISETRDTTLGETVTNESGDYVLPNITGDTYTVQVALQGFKTVSRPGIVVSPGDRVVVPALTLAVGGLDEEVEVRAKTPLIQAQSGERSFTVARATVENVPLLDRNFTTLAQLTPGVLGGPGTESLQQSRQPAARIGGGGQNNVMMDGISILDVGDNGQLVNTNVEAISEIKVLTSGYQAEYGRSSGLQITAVTKSGTNQFRGSLYDIERDSDWNANSWDDALNGDPKQEVRERDWGYTIGGPVGKPGGNNRLFFFYAHEYRPRETAGAINRFRVPTTLERQGDFSRSRDRNGNLVNLIGDPASGLPCTAGDTRGCFQNGGILGRIPQDRLDPNGLAILDLWPEPNTQGLDYNYEAVLPPVENLIQQPTIRVDYQASDKWRFTGKYSSERKRVFIQPGASSIPGFNDVVDPRPFLHTLSATANYTMNPTTFFEATYGLSQNTLAGGGANGVLMTDVSNRFNAGLGDLPLLFPNAGIVDPDTFVFDVLEDTGTPFFQGGQILLPPIFQFGALVGPEPPDLAFPGWLTLGRTQDVSASLTKLMGRHTVKVGFYLQDSLKTTNLNTGGGQLFQGVLNFGEDSNNPLDTGFGFSNAALGVFSSFSQQDRFVEGSYLYKNIEWYVQDNWKVTDRLTLDYGVRFTHQEPQYDQFRQSSNFFADEWSAASAPALFEPACVNLAPCAGGDRRARNPLTGELLGSGSAALIGQIVPSSGSLTNGIRQAGDGITKRNYEWPAIAIGPRVGVAYDLTGNSVMVLRGAWGLFFDRSPGNTIFTQVGNPPNSSAATVRFAELRNLAGAPLGQGVPRLYTYRLHNDHLPTSSQWNVGLQMSIPWSSTLDVGYVGQRSFHVLLTEQGGSPPNLNIVDFGTAFLPDYQDPTLAPSDVPGATALPTELLRPFTGFAEILEQQQEFWREAHMLQVSLQRRFQDGLSAGLNYNLTLSDKGTVGVPLRLEHGRDRSISIREDQQQYNELLHEQNTPTHIFQGNVVWELPTVRVGSAWAARLAQAVLNDWQLSAIWTGVSGTKYTVGYAYAADGANVNLTGSPDYAARIRIVGDPGSGCSDDRFRQFNTEAFAGPLPGSVGLESGSNYMTGCWTNIWNLALARRFRIGGTRDLQVRLELFNVFNSVVFTERNTTLQLDNPTDQNILNPQLNEDGSVRQDRLTPNAAGFGAATDALPLRRVQLQFRFSF